MEDIVERINNIYASDETAKIIDISHVNGYWFAFLEINEDELVDF